MTNDMRDRIANRIRELREGQGLTQADLAGHLGFASRQTVSDIENGKRRVEPAELARAAHVFGVGIDCLTDAFRLVGEGEFSFRAGGVDPETLDAFQHRAGVWVATYRQLAAQAVQASARISQRLELTLRSSFEDAQACGEALRVHWKLGDVPAETLESAIRRELGTLVLFVDAPSGISGAALRLTGLNAIFVNRNEAVGRRSFDLAHELFHLLTWEAMPPDRVESREVLPRKGNRVERLAENFAGALLMPRHVIQREWKDKGNGDPHQWLNATATSLGVSAVALKWRAVILGLLSDAEAKRLDDRLLAANGRLTSGKEEPPRLFSDDFVRRVHGAIQAGRLSVRRAARLLDVRLPALESLFGTYGLSLHSSA